MIAICQKTATTLPFPVTFQNYVWPKGEEEGLNEEFDFCFSSFVPTLRFLASDPADVIREKSVLCCLTLGRLLKDVVHPGSSGEEENSGDEESTLTERRPPPRRVKVSFVSVVLTLTFYFKLVFIFNVSVPNMH